MAESSYQQLVATRAEREARLRKVYSLPCQSDPDCYEARESELKIKERLDEEERAQHRHELAAAILKKSQKVAAALHKRQSPTHKVDVGPWHKGYIPQDVFGMSEPLWPLTYVVNATHDIIYLYYLARSYMCYGSLLPGVVGADDAYISACELMLASSYRIEVPNSHLEIILQALEELDE